MHPSSAIELAEEDRWSAGIGRGGAFGNRSSQTEHEGLELTAWEFRDEAAEVEEKKVAAKQARSVTDAVKPVAVEMASADAGSDTPEAHRIAEALANPPTSDLSEVLPAPTVQAGRYAFVDVSGKSRWKQEKKNKRQP
jgi:polygalacturonase